MFRFIKIISVSFLIIVFGNNCIHLNPKFRANKTFNGLDENFIAKKDSVGKVIFIIHGIGYKEPNYSYKLIKGIGKELLGKNFIHNQHDSIGNNTEKIILESKNNSNKVIFYSINWSPITEKYKNEVRENEFNTPPYNFNLSEGIKDEIMINRAGDLLLMQKKEALLKILNEIDASFIDAKNKNYNLDELNIISASIGSQVMLKYLDWKQRENIEKKNDYLKSLDSSKIQTADTNYAFIGEGHMQKDNSLFEWNINLNMYLLTNQLVLMGEEVKYWGGITNQNQEYSTEIKALDFSIKYDTINLVAFKNPNDFLCYTVPENISEKIGLQADSLNLTNVWYWNMLIKNNIISAHTSPLYLKKMYKVIANGSDAKVGIFNWKWVKIKNKKSNK